MSDTLKILRINNFIQRKLADITLDGKEVLALSLDRTCTFNSKELDEKALTDEELEALFQQTMN